MSELINDSDFKRYHRQISVPEFGELGQERLSRSNVLVIGCGGLGTLVCSYLVSCGLGSLVISDDDTIDVSNLPRQLNYHVPDVGRLKVHALKESLSALNAKTRVRAIKSRMGSEQLSLEIQLADIVVDCSDNFDTRFLVNRLCYSNKTILVSGSATGWKGQIATYGYQRSTACYQCMISPEDVPSSNNDCRTFGIIAPVTGVIASLQAVESIKVLSCEIIESVIQNSRLTTYDGLARTFDEFNIQPDPNCAVCGNHMEIRQ